MLAAILLIASFGVLRGFSSRVWQEPKIIGQIVVRPAAAGTYRASSFDSSRRSFSKFEMRKENSSASKRASNPIFSGFGSADLRRRV